MLATISEFPRTCPHLFTRFLEPRFWITSGLPTNSSFPFKQSSLSDREIFLPPFAILSI